MSIEPVAVSEVGKVARMLLQSVVSLKKTRRLVVSIDASALLGPDRTTRSFIMLRRDKAKSFDPGVMDFSTPRSIERAGQAPFEQSCRDWCTAQTSSETQTANLGCSETRTNCRGDDRKAGEASVSKTWGVIRRVQRSYRQSKDVVKRVVDVAVVVRESDC